MKKRFIRCCLASSIFLLTGCSTNIDSTLYLGVGNNQTAMVKYTLGSEMKDSYTISGSFQLLTGATLQDYSLNYTSNNVWKDSSYEEHSLAIFHKEDLEKLKDGDSYTALSFTSSINLVNVFPKDKTKTYFVVHTSDWSRSDATTYNCSEWNYTWESDTVKLSMN
jgi:hypothetical protein